MTNRTISKIVTFIQPFMLEGFEGMQPAGSYLVETEEELLQGLSFPAWRRVWTTIRLTSAPNGLAQVATIDPQALDAALASDTAE
jgi:hypothetical protein